MTSDQVFQLTAVALRRASGVWWDAPRTMKMRRAQRRRVRNLGALIARNLATSCRPEGVP